MSSSTSTNTPTHCNRRSILGWLAMCGWPMSNAFAETPRNSAKALINAARTQVGVTLTYDPAYSQLKFPGGDVPRSKGVCTDVLVRAYRDAFGIDLQRLVNEDMRQAFDAYPKTWGLKRTDANIDHRRVPNLQTFMRRKRANLKFPVPETDWRPGDIFTSLIDDKLPHIGIVSDRRAASGRWLVIHNIGQGAKEEDALTAHRLTGRYRLFLAA